MKIAFICVNYNNVNFTKQFIESINLLKGENEVSIIIVDNKSTDSSVEELQKINAPNINVIYSPENIGYFKGLNLGIQSIDSKMFDYVMIGNNDLYFQNDFLIELERKKFDKDILVIAPNIIRLDGVHQNPHLVSKFSKFERIYRRLFFSNYYISIIMHRSYNMIRSSIKPTDRIGADKESVITMGYGACYLLTRSFFTNFNELDAPNFLMGEEGVLANQVLSVDGKTLYVPNLVVTHHDHSSIGKVSSKKLYSFSRESYFYYLKNLKHIQ